MSLLAPCGVVAIVALRPLLAQLKFDSDRLPELQAVPPPSRALAPLAPMVDVGGERQMAEVYPHQGLEKQIGRSSEFESFPAKPARHGR